MLITYPLDLIKSRLVAQVSTVRYRGIIDAVKIIYNENGMKGFTRGLSPSLWGTIPFAGVNFYTYERLKDIYVRFFIPHSTSQHDIPTYARLIFGACSGLVAQTVTSPLDVIRRRMQMEGFTDKYNFNYKNTFQAIASIIRTEGWRGLFKGLSVNYVKCVPMISVNFTIYDLLKKHWLYRKE